MRRRYDTTTELPVITQTTERPARIEGVQADGLRAFFYGLAAMLFSIPVTVLVSGPWYVPLAVFAFIAPLAYVAHDSRAAAIAFLERQLHRDLDGDGEVGEPEPEPEPIRVNLARPTATGRAQVRRLGIPGVKAGPEMEARWFWRICRKGGEGFSQRIAYDYGKITRAEVKAIQDYFTSQVPPLAIDEGNRVVPTGEGLATMWGVVTRYFPDARLPQGRA